jgi:hypothetical protein
MAQFLTWCDDNQMPSIEAVQPLHVAAWIKVQTREHADPAGSVRGAGASQ